MPTFLFPRIHISHMSFEPPRRRGCRAWSPNAHRAKTTQNLLQLSGADPLPLEVGRNAVVAYDANLRPQTRIVRCKSNQILAKPGENDAPPNRIEVFERLRVELPPLGSLLVPDGRVARQQRRVRCFQQQDECAGRFGIQRPEPQIGVHGWFSIFRLSM